MNREDLIMVCSPDISGLTRGKAFPRSDLDARLKRGIGWVPTNIQITAFNAIAETPFGSLGDLLMIPGPETEVDVDFGDGSPREHFYIGNICQTDGTPWDCCLRGILSRALGELRELTGLELNSAFEQEFQFVDDSPGYGAGFSLSGFRKKKLFGEVFVSALRQAGVKPDTFLREWGDRQFEITMHPEIGVRAADHALIIRELARATADRMDDRITFTPLRDPAGAGNGVHIHMSFVDNNGIPATYDAEGPGGLGKPAAHFVAGILHHLADIVAITSPSIISYDRLTPHRWSAAFNNLGFRDREASVRICPVIDGPESDVARQFNFEFRAGDAAASPHLQQAAIIFAGIDGIRRELPVPKPTEDDLSLLNESDLTARGFTRLPRSLNEALARLERSEAAHAWFGDTFIDVYLKHKRGEMALLDGKTPDEIYQAYEAVY